MPERSIHYHGRPFPICARCTGDLAGILLGILIVCILGYPKFSIALLMALPLIVDGTLQRLTSYESKNGRRLITGILFGIALVFLFLYFHQMCIGIAGSILKWMWYDPITIDGVMKRFLLWRWNKLMCKRQKGNDKLRPVIIDIYEQEYKKIIHINQGWNDMR